MKTISIIIACYNEEESLPLYFKAVDEVLPKLENYRLNFVLVNDGSKDHTLEVMNKLYEERNDVTIVSLSRNYGQNPAFSAGLKACKGDYAIMMDADLQDPVELIPEIAKKFDEGYEVVNPKRVDRTSDSAFKRSTAGLFYKIINFLEGKKVIPENVNCFRGISRKVIDHINDLTEKDRYILAEVPLIGYKTCEIEFTRRERQAGESKYNVKKMVKYSLDNMSAETSEPLYWIIKTGVVSSLLTGFATFVMLILFILCCCDVITKGGIPITVLFLLFAIAFFFSILLCFIGLIGVYLHNILINTRNRPTYIIDIHKEPEDK